MKLFFLALLALSVLSRSITLPCLAAETDIKSLHSIFERKINLYILSEETHFNDQNCTAVATGDAVAIIKGQDSKLEADTIIYDREGDTLEAQGHVRITRHNMVTTGVKYKFRAASSDYLVTVPGTEINDVWISARRVYPPKDCHLIIFNKGKAEPLVSGPLMNTLRPLYISLGSGVLEKLHICTNRWSIYWSTCTNSFLRQPVSCEDWGRDKYGIGSVLYGSPLNRDDNFFGLGDGTCSIIVHRERPVDVTFQYLRSSDYPIIIASRQRYTNSRELRAVGQTAHSMGLENTKSLFSDRHYHELQVIPMDPIECLVLGEYFTIESPPFPRGGVPQLSQIVALHEMMRNRGRQYNDISVEQHRDVDVSSDAK